MSKKRNTTLVSVSRPDAIASWADRINAALQKTVDGIFETGRQLLAARGTRIRKSCNADGKRSSNDTKSQNPAPVIHKLCVICAW